MPACIKHDVYCAWHMALCLPTHQDKQVEDAVEYVKHVENSRLSHAVLEPVHEEHEEALEQEVGDNNAVDQGQLVVG